MTTPLWRLYLLGGLAATGGYLFLPVGVPRDAVYEAVCLSGSLAILVAVRLHRPSRPGPWWCLAAGLITWSCGDVVHGLTQDERGVSPFPGPAEVFYLGAYVLIAAAFVLLLRGRQRGRDRESLLDSSIFTVGFGLVAWVVLVVPAVTADVSTAARVLGLAFPLADVLLFGLLARLLTAPGGRTPAFRMLVGGGALLFAADITFALLSLSQSNNRGPVDLLFLSSEVLWGAAALHPSMRSLSEPLPEVPTVFTRRRLWALTAAGLTSPLTLAVQLLLGVALDTWATVISSIMLFLLVIARMSGLLSRLQAQAGELDTLSRTDALTGLPNRRSADAELGRALSRAQREGTPVSVAMVDLDHFKAFNDTFGHQAGDRLLTFAAAGWTVELGGRAILARYGGEEFLVIAPAIEVTDTLALLERLRRVTPEGQTFSAGVSGWDGRETAEAVVQRADIALYAAKRGGRDRVLSADVPVVRSRA